MAWAFAPTRVGIIDDVGQSVQPHVRQIQSIAPDAQVGFRGSLARGTKGPHKGNAPFDPNDFDVDAFIVSDSLAKQFPRRIRLRSGDQIPGIQGIQQSIESSLRGLPGGRGLRNEPFNFRIFYQREIDRLLERGDSQLFFVPGQ